MCFELIDLIGAGLAGVAIGIMLGHQLFGRVLR